SFDASTYAAAYGTGAQVTPLFADADMNRYDGRGNNAIAYYSRENWEGTVTPGPVKLSMTAEMAADLVLDDADLPDGTGVEFPTMGKSANLQLVNMLEYPIDDPMWDTFMDQLTYEELSSLTLTGLRETAGISSIGKPGTVDHNGPSGVTQRYSIGANGYATVTNDPSKDLKGTCYPCNGIIAATCNDRLVEEVGELIGEDAMWAGYAGLYGTGLNIHRSPYSGRVFEYYSEDGMLTALIDTAETRGIQSKGVYVYNKHFVLNDQENNRAGIGTWINEQALRENYLRAFELPIINADAKCVMTAYNRLGANWCGAYPELLINWLRGEAGMKGFAVTDMYDASFMVPVHEIVAGNDIPDGELDIASLAPYGPKDAKANAAVAQAMRASSKLVLYTVLHSRGMDGISQYSKVVAVTPWWQTALNFAQWSLLGLSCIGLVLLTLDLTGAGKKKGKKQA
ncbi:MAG: glycoside hydrolase family 3 protein, partial [Clostridia bacterium]|nr:glycoside hydrolase family 3 protein [Clostridia bacterium]